MNKIIRILAITAAFSGAAFAAEPKRLLVVTTSTGFRHTSIEVTEKVLRELAAKSKDFVVISTMDHPDYPDYTTAAGAFGRQLPDGTPAQISFIRKLNDRINSPLVPLQSKVTASVTALTAASLSGKPETIAARAQELGAAELALAMAKATQFSALQTSDSRLTDAQVQYLTGKGTAGAAPRTAFAPQVGAATPKQQKAIADANTSAKFTALTAALTAARTELGGAAVTLPRDAALIAAKAGAVAAAEQALATARAEQFAAIQANTGKFSPAVVKTMVSRFSLPESGSATTDGTARVLADLLTPESLKNFDGVFFASTTGDLPIPDKAAFMKWVENGGAWLGNHAALDSMHASTEWFAMTGGEFTGHGSQTTEEMTVMDTTHPIGAAFGSKTLTVHDEMYTFENQFFDFSKVHSILNFTKALNDGLHEPAGAPGNWGSVWIRNYGKGRVFYAGIGHREDLIDPVLMGPGETIRQNSPEVAMAYQRMLLAGVRWGLGIIPGDATPQIKVPTPGTGPGVKRTGRGAVQASVPVYGL